MHALDLETSSISGDLSDYMALEPWRARQGKGFISSLHVYGDVHDIHIRRPTRDQLIEVLEKLRGEEVYAHFALFDVAWLIASIEPNKLARLHSAIKGVRWRDTALLCLGADHRHLFWHLFVGVRGRRHRHVAGHPP